MASTADSIGLLSASTVHMGYVSLLHISMQLEEPPDDMADQLQ